MDSCIYISSSDDDLEEIDAQKRTLPQWATTTERSSGAYICVYIDKDVYI